MSPPLSTVPPTHKMLRMNSVPRRNGRPRVPRILIVLPNWVGDVVLATPALRALRERYPDAHITYLHRPYVRDLVAACPWADALLPWPRRSGRFFESGSLAMVTGLRRGDFGLAVLMTNSFRSALVTAAAGIQTRLGYRRDGRGILLTDRLVAPRRGGKFLPVSMVRYYNTLATYLGARPTGRLELFTHPDDEAALDARLAAVEPASSGPRVVINPGAAFGSAKCWFPDRFAAVARNLIERYDARVMIPCSPSERQVAAAISRAIPQPHVLFDEPILPLRQLTALIRRSDLLVTNDTGPRHFAVAFNVPVATIFGPTAPEWTATGYAHERQILVPVDCGPCMLRTCPLDHRCMKQVTAEMVTGAACELLDAHCSVRIAP